MTEASAPSHHSGPLRRRGSTSSLSVRSPAARRRLRSPPKLPPSTQRGTRWGRSKAHWWAEEDLDTSDAESSPAISQTRFQCPFSQQSCRGNASTTSPPHTGWPPVGYSSATYVAGPSSITRVITNSHEGQVRQGTAYLATWAHTVNVLPRVVMTTHAPTSVH